MAPKMTVQTQLVLRALLEHPTRELYGLQLSDAAGLATGTIHPILARLEGLGWLESRWEDIDPARAGRPRRRYYRLSPDGAEQARHALANARNPIARLAGMRLGLLGGAAG
jgi:PadR family transcriptional regulator, regulatory protein PadR